MRLNIRCAIAILTGAIIVLAARTETTRAVTAVAQNRDSPCRSRFAVNRGGAKDITLHNNLGFAPGTYRGVIADASLANANNYVRVDRRSAVIHLEAISSIVLPN